jgi:hypothetical protein
MTCWTRSARETALVGAFIDFSLWSKKTLVLMHILIRKPRTLFGNMLWEQPRRRAFARELSIAAHPRSTKDQAASDLSK